MPQAPTHDQARAALSEAWALLGRDPAAAEARARALLAAVPGMPDALLLRGRALAALGRIADATAAYREATDRAPRAPQVWRALATHLFDQGDAPGADAAFARFVPLAVNEPRLAEAADHLLANRIPEAERTLKPFLKAQPTDVAAIRMLAEVASRVGRHGEAEILLRRALQLHPGFDAARMNLATVLYRQGKPVPALAEVDALLAKQPGNTAYLNLRGAVLGRIGEYDAALACFAAVLERHPEDARVWLSYGHTLKTVGRQAESITAYRTGIRHLPSMGEAWWSLANLKTVSLDDADIAAMERALRGSGLDDEDRFHLHFALAKAREDRGDHARAFAAYAEGNRLRREGLDYRADDITDLVDRAIALFTPAFFAARAGQGAPSRDPIFVLGLPRSGSTLVEQILASHPQVEGTQELPDIQAIARRLSDRKLKGEDSLYPEILAEQSSEALRALGEEYLDRTRTHRKTGRPLFIDKMPNNWAHAGLIQLILPNAVIIDTRRHPLGCCFSNFKQHFARGQGFTYSFEDIGRYYRDYVRMMAHLDAVLPGRVHRVFYEAMIDDTEGEIRRLLAAAGLPFDPACLRFHETERAVRTASSEQVRRPIFRDGVDQWQRFDPWLGPLREVLGDVLDAYPAVPAALLGRPPA